MGIFGDFSVIGTTLYDVSRSFATIGSGEDQTEDVGYKTNPTRKSAGFVADIVFNTIIGFTLLSGDGSDETPEVDQTATDLPAPVDLTEVSPETISHLLQQLSVSEHLSSSMLYGEPIINFQIGDRTYHAVIGDRIEVFEGLNNEADVQFNTNEACFLGAIGADDPVHFLRNSGQVQFITVTDSKPELLAKGYLGLRAQLQADA